MMIYASSGWVIASTDGATAITFPRGELDTDAGRVADGAVLLVDTPLDGAPDITAPRWTVLRAWASMPTDTTSRFVTE